MMSNNSPCAACKIQRRKCTQECVFAPYFPPDNPQRFAYVHRVFGASNVAKLLNDLSAAQREDAVKSLAYEAEARLRDPVYGCVGLISLLQHKLKQLQAELNLAKNELASYVGPHAMLSLLQPPQLPRNNPNNGNGHVSVFPFGAANPGMVVQGVMNQPQLVMNQPQGVMNQPQEVLRFGFDGGGFEGGSSSSSHQSGLNLNHMVGGGSVATPSLALGPVDHQSYSHHYPVHQQVQEQPYSLVLQTELKSERMEGRTNRSTGPPSC